MSFGARSVALVKAIHITFKRWQRACEGGDAAVVGAVILASMALACLGI
jgi:hypothetical protein